MRKTLFIAVIFFCLLPALASAETLLVSWQTPTLREDGTAITNLSTFRIYYTQTSGNYSVYSIAAATNPSPTTPEPYQSSLTVPNSGTWYISVAAVDPSGNVGTISAETTMYVPPRYAWYQYGPEMALVSWLSPTANNDGTPLTDLSRFKVFYSQTSGNYTTYATVYARTAAPTSQDKYNLLVQLSASGTWYFMVRAVNAAGTESDNSTEVSKLIPKGYAWADGGAIFGGSAIIGAVTNQSRSQTMSGGAVFGGTASRMARGIARTMSGGAVFGGAATASSVHVSVSSMLMSGGAVFGGSATVLSAKIGQSLSMDMSGGAVFGGSALAEAINLRSMDFSMDGGAVFGGRSDSSGIHVQESAQTMSGGAVFGGRAVVTSVFQTPQLPTEQRFIFFLK